LKGSEQSAPQLMPVPVTVPEPAPLFATVSVKRAAGCTVLETSLEKSLLLPDVSTAFTAK
jgi:hypothetical protein